MKSIKQQYIELKEGKISQFNFMRNLRATLPQYVTNVTSFEDSIKILKNKGILTEADEHVSLKDAQKRAQEISLLNKQEQHINKSPNGDFNISDEFDQDNTIASYNNGVELKESLNDLDKFNSQEMYIGLKQEMSNNPKLNKNEATKIVIKNLKKNPYYYTSYYLGGKESDFQYMHKLKQGSDQMKPVKGNETNDKENSMKSPKDIEVVKASSNKASKETNKTPKNVKLMSLIAKTVRGLHKMEPTGEKMKKIKLKENWDEKADYKKEGEIAFNNGADKADNPYSSGSFQGSEWIKGWIEAAKNFGYDVIQEALNPESTSSLESLKQLLQNHDWYYMMSDDNSVYTKGEIEERKLKQLAKQLGQEGIDVYNEEQLKHFPNAHPITLNEVQANSLKSGQNFTMVDDLGKFVKGEEVKVISIKPYGNDLQITLSNGKDTDVFYLDKTEEI